MVQSIKVHILHTGTVIVDEALPFYHKNERPLAWSGLFRSKSHKLSLPVSTYLIEHPKGLVLIDTGWNSINRTHQIKNLSFQYPANKAVLPEGQAIDEQLHHLGFSAEDLDYVLLSHLHCDYADGLSLVKNAKNIIVSEEEWNAAKKDHLHYLPHEWKGVNVQTFKLPQSGKGPKGKSFALFGDGTVEMIWVPGHSAGLCATIIKNVESDDFLLLTSDVGYASKSWKENLTPGVVINRADAQESLDWVKEMVNNPNCIEAIANHDPEIIPHTVTL